MTMNFLNENWHQVDYVTSMMFNIQTFFCHPGVNEMHSGIPDVWLCMRLTLHVPTTQFLIPLMMPPRHAPANTIAVNGRHKCDCFKNTTVITTNIRARLLADYLCSILAAWYQGWKQVCTMVSQKTRMVSTRASPIQLLEFPSSKAPKICLHHPLESDMHKCCIGPIVKRFWNTLRTWSYLFRSGGKWSHLHSEILS